MLNNKFSNDNHLDEIEKRVNVMGYINDNIVQNFHHHGDNIGTQVKRRSVRTVTEM